MASHSETHEKADAFLIFPSSRVLISLYMGGVQNKRRAVLQHKSQFILTWSLR